MGLLKPKRSRKIGQRWPGILFASLGGCEGFGLQVVLFEPDAGLLRIRLDDLNEALAHWLFHKRPDGQTHSVDMPGRFAQEAIFPCLFVWVYMMCVATVSSVSPGFLRYVLWRRLAWRARLAKL